MKIKLRKKLSTFFDVFFKKSTLNENLVEECRNQINSKKLEILHSNNQYTETWNEFFLNFNAMLNSAKVHDFLRSPIVRDTMFYEAPFLEFKQVFKNWTFFRNALIFNPVGNPYPYGLYPGTNGNTVHHLFSISQIINSKDDLKKIDSIIEFGGGYGNMAWCFDKLGFVGSYTIFDHITMGSLQKMFLKSSKISNIREMTYLHDYDHLLKLISSSDKRTLLIATWSISEAPIEIRDSILSNKNLSLLIGFQKSFAGIDNLEYFNRIMKKNPNLKISKINHIPENYYLSSWV